MGERHSTLGAALVMLALLCGPARWLAAQQKAAPGRIAPATIVGHVAAARGGEAIRHALVNLVRTDSAVRVAAALTDGEGRFSFGGVQPGRYRIELERVGFEPEPGGPFLLAPGERRPVRLASAPRAVAIAPITAPGATCYTGSALDEAPAVAALWRQVAKAAEARRLFDRQYRYSATIRQILWQRPFLDAGRIREAGERSVLNDPTADRPPGGRDPSRRLELALPTGVRLPVLDLPDFWSADFLRTYCLLQEADREGERRLGFRTAFPHAGRLALRGTMVLDSALALLRVELLYLNGTNPFAYGVLLYQDLPVLGSPLRFASRLDAHSLTRSGTFIWEARVRIDDYRGFAPAPAR